MTDTELWCFRDDIDAKSRGDAIAKKVAEVHRAFAERFGGQPYRIVNTDVGEDEITGRYWVRFRAIPA